MAPSACRVWGKVDLGCVEQQVSRLTTTWHVFAATPVAASDLAVLQQLKSTFINFDEYARTSLLTGWDNSTSMCNWSGVTCNVQGYVQARLFLNDSLPCAHSSILNLL